MKLIKNILSTFYFVALFIFTVYFMALFTVITLVAVNKCGYPAPLLPKTNYEDTPQARIGNLEIHGEVYAISRINCGDWQFETVLGNFLVGFELQGDYSDFKVHDKVIVFAHKEVGRIVYDWMVEEPKEVYNVPVTPGSFLL